MKKYVLPSTLFVFIFVGLVGLSISGFVKSSIPESCLNQAKSNEEACREMEQRILRSTVQIEVESWTVKEGETGYKIKYSSGHGTIVDGRFLVTHNHYTLPLTVQSRLEESDSYAILYLYDVAGNLRFKGPLSDFQLAVEDEETLVIAHREDKFFEALGFTSAVVQSWPSLSLQPGMTVALIDWDGETSRVNWVSVQKVILTEGTPRLVLTGGVSPGASGGGIFWNGVHVANTWRVEERIGPAGEVVGAVTTVALNSLDFTHYS